jgi:hypothetical protein
MAKKNIGIYSNLESTSNNKVEDLYLIVDNNNIVFSVKHKKTNEFVAFEHFSNNQDNAGWHQLVAYLQNNSKLIHGIFGTVFFVWNSARFILTNKLQKEDTLVYLEELNMVHGKSTEEELYLTPFNDQLIIAFTVPDALSTLLSRSFPTGKWHHYAEYVLANKAENEALIYLFENNFCLRVINDGKTQLVKYFPIEGEDQNCYQLLNACSNAGLDTNLATLKVWGYNSIQHEFINKIAPYFLVGEIIESPKSGIGASLNTNYPQNIYSTYFIF